MVTVVDVEHPFAVVIVQVALYIPPAVYTCTGVAAVDIGDPSAKFQE